MEAKNMDSMREMDNSNTDVIGAFKFVIEYDMEMAVRAFQKEAEKSKVQITDENMASMLKQWRFNSEYIPYFPDETELLILEDRMFLIPKEDKKPIKLIIA